MPVNRPDGDSPDGPATAVLAAILCGGRSRRFGGGKERAPLRGRPLVSYPLAAAADAGMHAVLVGGDPGLAVELGAAHLPDAPGLSGPAAGLVAALRHAATLGRDGVILLGADMPLVSASLLTGLAARGVSSATPALALESPPGRLQPLGAFYATTSLGAVTLAARGPRPSLHSVFRGAGGVAVDPGALDLSSADVAIALTNVNTAADLAMVEEQLG